MAGGGWFIDSHNGNIKEEYHFIEKIASGGFGVVYLAEHRKTSNIYIHIFLLDYSITFNSFTLIIPPYIEVKYAIKAIQKKRVKDYLTF